LEYFLPPFVTSNLLKIEKGVLSKQGGWKIRLGTNSWWVGKRGRMFVGGGDVGNFRCKQMGVIIQCDPQNRVSNCSDKYFVSETF